MVFTGELAEGLANDVMVGVLIDAENFIVVAEVHEGLYCGFVFLLTIAAERDGGLGLQAGLGNRTTATNAHTIASVFDFHESEFDFFEEVRFAFGEGVENFIGGFIDLVGLLVKAFDHGLLLGEKKFFKVGKLAGFHAVFGLFGVVVS